MTAQKIVVRIDRVLLDAVTAGGRSAAEVAEVLGAALRADLAAAAEAGVAPAGGMSVSRLRVTAEDGGIDAVARAASLAVADVMTDLGGCGRTPQAGGSGTPGRRRPSLEGGDTR